MKLLAYLRVSTATQAEQGLGLDIQEQAIRSFVRKRGDRLVGICRDEGPSGSNGLDTRDGLGEAFSLLKDGQAHGLVVSRLDRLARDLIIQETLLLELRRLRAEVFTTSAAEQGYLEDDPQDPSRKLIRQVLGAVSEYERSMIALRLRSGRRRKAELGGFAYGAPPYGYRAEDGELVADPAEQAAASRIAELRAAGQSYREIAAALTSEGHTTKAHKTWWPATVRRISQRSGSPVGVTDS